MDQKSSLVIFSRASQMLAEADTIQKTKELKDLALTAADWAKRKGLGEEAIRYARSYALEAERKMGEMLADTERAKGGRPKISSRQPRPLNSEPTLADLGLTKDESSRAQKLAGLPRKKFDSILSGEISLIFLHKTHITHNTGEQEWDTPRPIIEAARKAMGGIDIDPASSERANKRIKAKTFYTAENNGLDKEWPGRVWLNPPYGLPLVAQFSETLLKKIETGEVKEACVLVNNATETAWFQAMLNRCDRICFIRGRLKFLDSSGMARLTPLQGQMIIYFGKNKDGFSKSFSAFGVVK